VANVFAGISGESVPFVAADMPYGWPVNESGDKKELHQLTRDELGSLAGPSLLAFVTGNRG
jgi:hypothetical protein